MGSYQQSTKPKESGLKRMECGWIFHLYIQFDAIDRFYVTVYDWYGMEVVKPRVFGRFDEAFEYLYDVDCEKFVDEQWDEFQKMI